MIELGLKVEEGVLDTAVRGLFECVCFVRIYPVILSIKSARREFHDL